MATVEVVEWVCDLCGREAEPVTHTVDVDGKAVELEACPRCWKRVQKVADEVRQAGRRPKRRKAA